MRTSMHRSVSVVAEESRSVQYSAEAPAANGRVACHVLRYHGVHDARVRYTIAVRNETDSDVRTFAFASDVWELRNSTIVQATVAAYSDFSTTIELELARYGGVPTLHVELSGNDIDFALIVPKSRPLVDGESRAIAARAGTPAGLNPLALAASSRDATFASERSGISPIGPGAVVAHRLTAPALNTSGATARVFVESPSVLPGIAFFALVMTVATLWLLRPHVGALVVPSTVRAESPIVIAYRATGIGQVNFDVFGPDGGRVADGRLTSGSGAFALTLPKAPIARAYLVRVGVTGLLGSQFAEAYVKLPNGISKVPPAPRIAPPIDAPPPEIRSLALDRTVFHGGDTLHVYYDVLATRGSVAVIDPASQITYGSSSLAATGHSAFALPRVDSDRFLTIVVTASRARRTIQSRIAITVQPVPSPSPSGAPASPSDPLDGNAPLITAPDNVVAGRPIVVTMRGQATDIVVALVDSNGTAVERRPLPSAAGSVTFTAPSVRVVTRYEFQATYSQGAGSETVVRAITVVPR